MGLVALNVFHFPLRISVTILSGFFFFVVVVAFDGFDCQNNREKKKIIEICGDIRHDVRFRKRHEDP